MQFLLFVYISLCANWFGGHNQTGYSERMSKVFQSTVKHMYLWVADQLCSELVCFVLLRSNVRWPGCLLTDTPFANSPKTNSFCNKFLNNLLEHLYSFILHQAQTRTTIQREHLLHLFFMEFFSRLLTILRSMHCPLSSSLRPFHFWILLTTPKVFRNIFLYLMYKELFCSHSIVFTIAVLWDH